MTKNTRKSATVTKPVKISEKTYDELRELKETYNLPLTKLIDLAVDAAAAEWRANGLKIPTN
jgi:hypothetical protein